MIMQKGKALEKISINLEFSAKKRFFYFQIDFHFHYLEVQAIESKKPNQVIFRHCCAFTFWFDECVKSFNNGFDFFYSWY